MSLWVNISSYSSPQKVAHEIINVEKTACLKDVACKVLKQAFVAEFGIPSVDRQLLGKEVEEVSAVLLEHTPLTEKCVDGPALKPFVTPVKCSSLMRSSYWHEK